VVGVVLFGALILTGSTGATGPATSWASTSAGQQTLDAYRSLTSYQRATVIYTTTPPSMPSPGGAPIYTYPDWTTTATSSSEFETAAQDVLTRAKIAGRFMPALRLLGTISLGVTAFDIGWRFSTGQSLWSEIFGSSEDVASAPGTYATAGARWAFVTTGGSTCNNYPGLCGTNGAWVLQWRNLPGCAYIGGTNAYYSEWVNPDATRFNTYECTAQAALDAAASMALRAGLGTVFSRAMNPNAPYSNCGPATTAPGASGSVHAISSNVIALSEPQMLNRLRITAPVPYTNQTAPGGTTNTGTYTRPADQGNASDVAASDAAIAPGTSWTDLTPQQKAAIPVLVLGADPMFAPIADQQTMPNCIGLTATACDALLDGIAASGTRTYTVVDPEDADLDQQAGAVISQTIPPDSSFARTTNLTLTTNPDPLPSCETTTQYPHWSSNGNTVLAKAAVTCNYTGTVVLFMTLWKCTGSPSANAEALDSGIWGCSVAATTEQLVPVEAGLPVDPAAYCPQVGADPVEGNAYFIARTTIPNGPPSWSADNWFVEQP
jgi:hypothetical protein